MPVEILLVEDNGADVRIIREIVSQTSVAIRLTIAENGEEALALLANPLFKPDLIITDTSVPKSCHSDVLRLCQASGLPVVVFSGSTSPSVRKEALKLGAKEFIEKPLDLDAYTDAVWKMIWKWAKPSA